MIKSMTGFGKGEHNDEKRSITVEVKSVNHRYNDIYVKMPKRYSFAEEKIKSIAKEYIKRGKSEISLIIESVTKEDINIKSNTPVAKQYIDNLNLLKEEFDLKGDLTVSFIAGLPDVLKAIPNVDDEEEVLKAIEEALTIALTNHNHMRRIEGEKLAEDLIMRGELIRGYLKEIEKNAPLVKEQYITKLRERISELVDGSIEIPEDRILLEAAIFADKASITEELVRMDSHIIQLNNIIGGERSDGKKLDFLVQEMNREANTIGSKANSTDITRLMLEIKSEVEKIREQVQNIE